MASRTRKKSVPAKSRSAAKETPLVVIAQTQANDKCSLLDAALTQSGFWPQLEQALQVAAVPGSEFSILIKPDLELFNPGDSTGTDPWTPIVGMASQGQRRSFFLGRIEFASGAGEWERLRGCGCARY